MSYDAFDGRTLVCSTFDNLWRGGRFLWKCQGVLTCLWSKPLLVLGEWSFAGLFNKLKESILLPLEADSENSFKLEGAGRWGVCGAPGKGGKFEEQKLPRA